MNRYDVSSSFTQIVDADPSMAREVLARSTRCARSPTASRRSGSTTGQCGAEGSEELSYQLDLALRRRRGATRCSTGASRSTPTAPAAPS